MKNKFNVLLIVLLGFTLTLSASKNPRQIQVNGKVTCDGTGIPSVMVTDGVAVVETDRNGRYTIESSSKCKFVYYSLPSAYESTIQDGVPVFYAEIDTSKKAQQINFALSASKHSQTKHAFILMADPQVQDIEEFDLLKIVIDDVKQTAAGLSAQMPVHAIGCGDLVFDQLQYFDVYKQVIAQSRLPFYQLVGNHDMDYNNRSDELSDRSYTAEFGPAYYSFNKGLIHYVVLKDVFYYGDSYRYMGYVDERQLLWLEKDLSKVKPGSTVVVSLHIPTFYGDSREKDRNSTYFISNSVMNSAALYKILSPYKTHILAGHSHTQWNTVLAPNLFEHTHAAACAAWWQGEICVDGTPKGYTVYIADGDSLSWYFKGVNLDKDEQFKLYTAGSDTLYPGYIIVNVYNFDPSWTVKWFENDVLIGQMEQYWGVDPLAKSTYVPGKNKKYSWLSAGETHHLFKAKIQNPGSKIRVQVTDRFGKVYEKTE